MRAPLEYHEIHRLGRSGPWRPIVGVVGLIVATFALAPLLWTGLLALWFSVTSQPVADSLATALDLGNVTSWSTT